ncbi:DMT family transporter [Bacteroidota bacterium]
MKIGKYYISRGILYMVIASIVFAAMGAFVKIVSRDLNSIIIVFFRNVIGIVLIGSTFFHKPLRKKGGRFGLLMFRGIIGTFALYALFYNVDKIGLGTTITYIQTSPIFIAVLSLLFLNERLSIWGWLAIFIGFGGILMIFQPSASSSVLYNSLGIFSGLAAAAAYTAVRELRNYYETRVIVLSFMIWGIILPLISMGLSLVIKNPELDFLITPFVIPRGIQWLWLLLVGATAMIGQVLITSAYREEKAGIISTVGYVNIPFALFFGILLGDSIPDLLAFLGILLIILSGGVISIRRNL